MTKMNKASLLLRLARLTRLTIVLLCATLVHGCATNPVSGESDLVLMSEEQEIVLGRKLSKTLPKQFGGVFRSPRIENYVSAVGERVAATAHRQNLLYHFTVLDSPAINAFALPGGYVYITRGMLAQFNSEGELAAVLGHELGHITARHAVTQHTKSTLLDILGLLAVRAADASGTAWDSLRQTLSLAIVRGYGRENEHQADTLGVEYLAKAGYRPDNMLDVLNILKAQEKYHRAKKGDRVAYHGGLLSTHPENDARMKKVVKAAERFVGGNAGSDRREVYLEMIDGLEYGESAKQGIVRNTTFYHAGLGIVIRFPTTWKVTNRAAYLEAESKDGNALIRLTLRDRNRRESEVQHLKRHLESNGLRDIKPLSGALGGWTARANLTTKFGEQLARVGVIFKGKSIYTFSAAAKTEEDFAYYDYAFIATMDSFRRLRSEEDKEMAQPRRVRIVRTEAGDTVDRIIARLNLESDKADEIRLLNGLYPSGEPPADADFKIIR